MYSSQISYRELYDQILEYNGEHLFKEIVSPWLNRQRGERQWLKEFSARRGNPIPSITDEDSCRLYALSRISDLFILSFAPPGSERQASWQLAKLTMNEYVEVMTFFGFTRIDRSQFHPFFHEVVTVEQSNEPYMIISVKNEYWPGFLLGQLLFSRSGCRVTGGVRNIVKRVAENSTLYWAFARNTRPTADLSVGWGSNSQWRTRFRRDYIIGNKLFYNVDAQKQRPNPDENLSADEQLELLKNRCFIICDKAHDDLWPYDLNFHEEIQRHE